MPVYELTIAKGGLKIKEAATPDSSAVVSKDGPKLNTNKLAQPYNDHLRIVATNMPARTPWDDVNAEGLTGYYDFTLEFAADALSAPRPEVEIDDPAPDFFTAINRVPTDN